VSALGRLAAVLLPWPARQERQEAIDRARAEKERSRAAAAHAAEIGADIDRLHHQNHIAERVAASLIRGHQNGTAGG
jgi:exopolyphosphatase/pppGpp-phosphohydrolase